MTEQTNQQPQETQPEVATDLTNQSEPTNHTGGISISDINNAAIIIDMAVKRGAFSAKEAVEVGTIYDRLATFVSAAMAEQEARKEKQGDHTTGEENGNT